MRPWALAVAASCIASAAPADEKPIHALRWRDAAGACAVPPSFPAWSWHRLTRVEGAPDKTVVFTVDGGLTPESLEHASQRLRSLEVRATFFLMTGPLAKSPRGREIVQRLVADGHELGNHTVHHPHLTRLSDARVREELGDASRFLSQAIGDAGAHSPLFREPFLDRDARTDALLREQCLRSVGFSVYTRDDQEGVTAKQIERAVLFDHDKPRVLPAGAILMFHASQKENEGAWPVIVRKLRRRGHTFTPLGEALRAAAG